jgi:glycosyl transferase family 87
MNKLSVWWWALIVYSVAHFIYSAVYGAWTTLGGDLLSAFPGPLTVRVGQAWPVLARSWTTEALGMGPVKWNYGPALHIMLLPFSFASTQFQAMRLILLFDYALVAATFAIWIRLLFPDSRPTRAWIAILCLWLNYFPLLEAIVGREIELVELFLLTLAIHALRQQREVLAGASIGVAAMLKFLPAVFIPYLFVKGYRRAGWVAAAAALSIAILAQPLLGWQRAVTISIANKEIAGSDLRTSYANQALTNVLYKTFTAFNIKDPHPPTLYPQTLRPLAFSLSFVVVVATAWFIVRWRRCRFLELEFALLAIVMCLVVSHANTYYFVFALPALSVALAATAQRPDALGTLPKAALAAAIVLSGFLVPMKVFELITHIEGLFVARVLQGWSLPAYGAILAAGLMVELHRLSRARADAIH